MNKNSFFLIMASFIISVGFSACDDNDNGPTAEIDEGQLDEVILTFTPITGGGGTPLEFSGASSDGVNFELDAITLDADTPYRLSIDLETIGESDDLIAEIGAARDEYIFFFGWTSGFFATPSGDGNIDDRSDDVLYNDRDGNGNPVGLSTTWTTAAASSSSGNFRFVLKFQPDTKSATSTIDDGETEIDLTWELLVQ